MALFLQRHVTRLCYIFMDTLFIRFFVLRVFLILIILIYLDKAE